MVDTGSACTNLRFSFGSWRCRCIIFVLLLTCLAAFALTLLVCLFACRRKRNDRTRRGPMQRGATLPLPSRWPSTKGCSNTCGQPHWASPLAICPSGRCAGSAGVSRPAPDIYTSRPTYIKDTTRRNTTPSAVATAADAAAAAARERLFLSVRTSLATTTTTTATKTSLCLQKAKCSGIKARYVKPAVAE